MKLYQGGNMWAQYDSYITAFRDVLGLELPEYEKYIYWEQAAIHGGFRLMHKEFCMVCDFPEVLKKDDQNRPHCIDGPSHRWRDGWEIYHLNGARVPKWLVMTSYNQLDPHELTKNKELKNVEVRREFVRKVGIERCLDVLGWSPKNQVGDYQLGEIFVGETPRRYLKMLNPSVGIWHLEAVHPDCNTVQEAINWRASGDKSKQWSPIILS